MSMRAAYFKLTKQATYKNSVTIYSKTLDAQSSQGIHPAGQRGQVDHPAQTVKVRQKLWARETSLGRIDGGPS